MRKLLATVNDNSLTLMRLVLGVVFFLHGSQKMLGWFGGFGFSGTMNFFTSQMHIPAPFAFLAICAEFSRRPGVDRRTSGQDRGVWDRGKYVGGDLACARPQRTLHELVRQPEGRRL